MPVLATGPAEGIAAPDSVETTEDLRCLITVSRRHPDDVQVAAPDELWDEIKKQPDAAKKSKMRAEAIQIAAMAIRFVQDLCDDN